MSETFLNGMVTMHCGDALAVLRSMPDESVDCIVTSPPYWGLRNYGVDGQLGLERSLGEHIAVMVEVFREVRRVLKKNGTLWLNYGDCYATSVNGRSAADTKAIGEDDRTFRDKPFSTIGPVLAPVEGDDTRQKGSKQEYRTGHNLRVAHGGYLKPKDLCMVPNRLAIALQDDGWWVRAECIWGKTNPMPTSVKDRPGTAHEKVWLLTKAQHYFYDYAAAKQPAKWANSGRSSATQAQLNPERKRADNGRVAASFRAIVKERNLRNYEPAPLEVWEIPTRAYRDAHFATFPPELAERCIKAGCPKDGIVLDPFGGAGTVSLVAARLGIKSAFIELNPEYCAMAKRRIELDWMGPEERKRALTKPAPIETTPLFANDNDAGTETDHTEGGVRVHQRAS